LKANGTPFVITSGYDEFTVPADYGNAPRLMKPFDGDELLAALTAALTTQASD
jgi:hypothetical protein